MQIAVPQVHRVRHGLALDGAELNRRMGGILRRLCRAVGDPNQQTRTQQKSGDSDTGHSAEEEESFEKRFSANLKAPDSPTDCKFRNNLPARQPNLCSRLILSKPKFWAVLVVPYVGVSVSRGVFSWQLHFLDVYLIAKSS